ncbi:arsinothricin resistance N-acetyltransferase ArsN1 family A (plasmid) [Niallia taxi]|uniref:N-acetyltransferase family protein n=1 Tax=Niallia taxi TaxID=2499688 RepID=A0A3S2TU50_9BACI|nr:arsinothricin resistance N-acetyltransferase ArsN1 family A [Niallia taxi]MDK8643308.1 arsinothricin resistance N-acetyltransferase ArsN1 [Niallia taxi]MED4055184.1 arsinothricin resistance N-acetyltransferase ArsN1 [Niallia taxi]RVT57025.1 N-acetyltransferase family protein [Niallia taxi]
MLRKASAEDLKEILEIYNQGIEDGLATFEEDLKDKDYMENWFAAHQGRYAVFIAVNEDGKITGWASINPYNTRTAYYGVGELSIYIHRDFRGKGIGHKLLQVLEDEARLQGFYKIVLFTFPINKLGQGLYRKLNYREVGLFKNQGRLRGKFVDVMLMEKLLFNQEYYL